MLLDQYKRNLHSALVSYFKTTQPEGAPPTEIALEVPPDMSLGDFAFPTFRLAKQMRKAPPLIASDLVTALINQNPSLAATFEILATGPYVNFKVRNQELFQNIIPSLFSLEENLKNSPFQSETVVLDFSSPNIAKPFNIYHLRSTMIGNCLSRIYKSRGSHVVRINHLGDWGTQYGTLALAFQKWGNDEELVSRGIGYLVELYVRMNKAMEEDPSLKDQARETFAKLEAGEKSLVDLWRRFSDLSIKEFSATYQRLNVEFDHFWGESFYINQIPSIEAMLEEKKLLQLSEGAHVVDLSSYEMPPCFIRKQDGSTIYATRDLAAAIYRYNQFQFTKMLYVVGAEQRLHFSQVFKVLELAHFPWASRCQHLDFGLYRFKDAKMSTRKGNFITMESVLDQAVIRVQELMQEKQTNLSQEEINANAETIGVGAIIFNDLSTDRNSDVNFDLDRILDFEGETGPYVLYAHTRCLSLMRNAPEELRPQGASFNEFNFDRTQSQEEINLIKMLARFPLILDDVLTSYKPHILTHYLIEVTKSFNQFYRAHRILSEDADLSKTRLALVFLTQQVLQKGLHLLGMRTPERM